MSLFLTAVVITTLNAYSGFALVAEGMPEATVVEYPLILWRRLHAGQQSFNHSRSSDRCERQRSIVHHGTALRTLLEYMC